VIEEEEPVDVVVPINTKKEKAKQQKAKKPTFLKSEITNNHRQ